MARGSGDRLGNARAFSSLMGQCHVFAGAHFDQSADGACELLAVRTHKVQLGRRNRRRKKQLYPMIVKHVDKPGKPPCRVAHVRGQARHVGDDDDRKPPRELQIVDLRSGTLAQGREAEPDHGPRASLRSPVAFLVAEWRSGLFGAWIMGLRHGLFCLGCCWIAMLLLFVLGVMNLFWIATLAAFVLLERTLPNVRWFSAATGVLFIGWGLALLAGVGPVG